MISITMLSGGARAAAEAQKEATRAEQEARAQIEDTARRSTTPIEVVFYGYDPDGLSVRTSREFRPEELTKVGERDPRVDVMAELTRQYPRVKWSGHYMVGDKKKALKL